MWGATISRRRLSAKILEQIAGSSERQPVAAAAARAHGFREPGMKASVDTSAFSRALRQPTGLDPIYRAIAASYGYVPVTRGDEHTMYRLAGAPAARPCEHWPLDMDVLRPIADCNLTNNARTT